MDIILIFLFGGEIFSVVASPGVGIVVLLPSLSFAATFEKLISLLVGLFVSEGNSCFEGEGFWRLLYVNLEKGDMPLFARELGEALLLPF